MSQSDGVKISDAVAVQITETVKTPPVKSGDDAGKNKDNKKRSGRKPTK